MFGYQKDCDDVIHETSEIKEAMLRLSFMKINTFLELHSRPPKSSGGPLGKAGK